MKKIQRLNIVILFMLVVLTAIGQTKQPEITAKFSADSIMIGDQFYLDIKIDTCRKSHKINYSET